MTPLAQASESPIVIFDGECAFCHRGVQFIINHDPRDVFLFAPRQSSRGQELLGAHGLLENLPDSMVLIERDRAWIRSDAVLRIAGYLKRPWRWLALLRFVPRFLRDPLYKLVARNRHRFSKPPSGCIVPSPDLVARLIQ